MAKDKNVEEITVANPTVEELKELETKAKKDKKGLWQKESSSSTTSKKSKNKNILENITDTLQSIVNLLSQISKVFKFR